MTTQYSININEKGEGVVSVIEDGRVRTWSSVSDPNFNHIVAAVHKGKTLDEIPTYKIPTEITHLSSRVTIKNEGGKETLCFDGKPVEGPISDTAMRYRLEGRDIGNIVRFMERLSDNVSFKSRSELFKWLQKQELQIDEEGFVIGYRGLTADRHSQHAGGAYVTKRLNNGEWGGPVWVDGHVPNFVGTIVSMNRKDVDDNSGVGCSHGLHVGSEAYARSWADSDTTIVVRVDPADVVSVPNGDYSKMRVCRYEILSDLQDDADHEPEVNEDKAVVPTVEGTAETLDEIVPPKFREKMSRTQRFTARFLRK